MFLDATSCAAGGYAGEEMGDYIVYRALWGTGDLCNTWEEEVKSL